VVFLTFTHIYDRNAAKLEEIEKVLIDLTLDGKTCEEMGLEPFRCTEIRSSIMGIPVFISEEIISFVLRRAKEELETARPALEMRWSINPCSTVQ